MVMMEEGEEVSGEREYSSDGMNVTVCIVCQESAVNIITEGLTVPAVGSVVVR